MSARVCLLAWLFLFTALPQASAKPNPACVGQKMREIEEELHFEEKNSFEEDLGFLREQKRASAFGRVNTDYDSKYKTRFYYTNTAKPRADGTVPRVDVDADALYVFFHGSGTMKASGRNFADKMNDLAGMNYSAISFDQPFHAEGPTAPAFNDATHYMNWLHKIVQEHRIPGKPVIFVGHSFGPDVILEYNHRFPGELDGYAAVSPAGFNKVLDNWYRKHTEKMKFGGEVPSNTPAGIWSGTVSDQFQWKNQRAQPGEKPNPRFRILSGDLEEYVPAPVGGPNKTPTGKNTYDICKALRAISGSYTCTLEPGIGHYIFQHLDKDGNNAITREMLAADGKKPADAATQRDRFNARPYSQSDILGQRLATDRLFQQWVEKNMSPAQLRKIVADQRDPAAKAVLAQYDVVAEKRREQIDSHIIATQTWAPQFYAANKQAIDGLAKSKAQRAGIYEKFLNFLSTQSDEIRAQYAVQDK